MAITAGETLSLNALGSATGQATKSLSAAKGNTTGPISLYNSALSQSIFHVLDGNFGLSACVLHVTGHFTPTQLAH